MRNDAPQTDVQHGERLVQAQRISQVLRDLEQRLHFLPGPGDQIQKVHAARRIRLPQAIRSKLQSRPPAPAPRSTFTSVESAAGLGAVSVRLALPLHVALLQSVHHARIESLPGFRPHHFHGLFERQRTAVLPVGGQRIQAIHRRQNARPDGNLLAREARRDSPCRPTFRDAPARSGATG